ncbi:unnamed protein product [marine sediment metagenome]|uniref:Uncharacterized protein n=1 Tax=marine sediment metagenome TaxID=412755 RepID=X1VJJ9_9ZZZZ
MSKSIALEHQDHARQLTRQATDGQGQIFDFHPWLIHPLKREESYIIAKKEMSHARAHVFALEGLAEPVA